MTMTAQAKASHDLYELLPASIRLTVDGAFKQATKVLAEAGLLCDMNDDAETLVAALTDYVIASNPRLRDEMGWRCLYCGTAVNRGQTCFNRECVTAHGRAQRRMGIEA